jgi:rubredoxin
LSRNNEQRTAMGANSGDTSAAIKAKETFRNPLEFVTPTDFVTLPSKGRGYPATHPLHNKEVIEIKYMTAKEEDILTSRTLLKKNLAIERFLQSIILDKNIKAKDMLIGDRNAVLVAARASGYGEVYETGVVCPECGERSKVSFDLSNPKINEAGKSDYCEVTPTENGTYILTAPVSKFKVELKLMTGEDEAYVMHAMQANKKNNLPEANMSEQYKRMVVSVEGYTEQRIINHFLQNAPARDLRNIRIAYKDVSPDIKITEDFECPSCGHEQELEVPFGADFFWPDR